jgi:hypothetical protein
LRGRFRSAGDLVSSLSSDSIRPVKKELPVAESCLGVLINRNDDCLDVLVTPAFSPSQMPNLGKRLVPGGVSPFGSHHFSSCIFTLSAHPRLFPWLADLGPRALYYPTSWRSLRAPGYVGQPGAKAQAFELFSFDLSRSLIAKSYVNSVVNISPARTGYLGCFR